MLFLHSQKTSVEFLRKRATNYRALLRKTTYEDKATYDSTPSCNNFFCRVDLLVRSHSTCCFCILKRLLWIFFNTCSLRQVQPVSEEMRLEMIIGIQNGILNSQSSCFFFKWALWKETCDDHWRFRPEFWSFRIPFWILMTILCQNILCRNQTTL